VSTPQQTIVVTLGARGALWVKANGHGHSRAFHVEVVDTVGGGDAFNAGLAVALAEKQPLAAALNIANATAALCVTRQGAAASMPQRAEVDRLVHERHSDET